MSEHCEQLCSLCSTNKQSEQLVFSLYIETRIRLSYKSYLIYLNFNLLLRLLSCNFLLSSDCLHCLKTSTNLFNSIILSNISHESTSVTINCLV
jgi:hypothetical protein